MVDPGTHRRWIDRAAPLTLVLTVALGLRVVAAVLLSRYVERLGKLCLFGDTGFYWELARTIVAGETYQGLQGGVPHYALRTPGYPLFLAACRALFGPNLLAVRLAQAALGTLAVWLVYRLARATIPDEGRGVSVGLIAATLVAVEPYTVGMSVLVLSEGLFIPLMMAGLWGLAALWGNEGTSRPRLIATLTGLAMGFAILARPSWALFVPIALVAWVIGAGRGSRMLAFRRGLIVALATAAVMAPWWARNARVVGRFVPTALWVGASLYDGIRPDADGASDLDFVDAPDVRSLPEVEQDAVFRARAVGFAREHPGRVIHLAWIKLGRFWSPWPNADTLFSIKAAVASSMVTLPTFAMLAVGLWVMRRDARAMVILAGPLVYFCILHMVFVSSIRYRVPGMVPAMVLVAVGVRSVGDRPLGRPENRGLVS